MKGNSPGVEAEAKDLFVLVLVLGGGGGVVDQGQFTCFCTEGTSGTISRARSPLIHPARSPLIRLPPGKGV